MDSVGNHPIKHNISKHILVRDRVRSAIDRAASDSVFSKISRAGPVPTKQCQPAGRDLQLPVFSSTETCLQFWLRSYSENFIGNYVRFQ